MTLNKFLIGPRKIFSKINETLIENKKLEEMLE